MTLKIPDFSKARVLVLGDLMLDRYWGGPTSRISPEAPVPIVKIEQREERAGGAGNVALNMASLKCSVNLIGLIGEDEAGEQLLSMLSLDPIHCDLQPVATHPTITKVRVLSRQQQLIRLDFETPFSTEDTAGLEPKFEHALKTAGVVVLSDYGKGVLTDPQPYIQKAKASGIPVLVDPKGNDFSRYRGATLITPNLSEFEAVVGHCPDEKTLISRGHQLMQDVDLEALLITRSEKGMTLLQPGQPPLHLPTRAREVYDVTGAGDTVIAMLAAALAAGSPLPNAMALANMAAGIVVGKLGTATVSPSELRQALAQGQQIRKGVLVEDELVAHVRAAQQRGEKVVMTNGCFDLLHPGHVSYLRNAKKLGDHLIVAVNDDASVARLKGPQRPINHLTHRMDVLAGLEAVDWVVPFSEDTPERIITRLSPDILVKGGDYNVESIAGAQSVLASGGEVKVLNFEDGYSTTQMIQTILGQNDTDP